MLELWTERVVFEQLDHVFGRFEGVHVKFMKLGELEELGLNLELEVFLDQACNHLRFSKLILNQI